MCITYKKGWNVFQYDTVCGDGYILPFISVHDNTPYVGWPELLPTIKCVLCLIKKLARDCNQVFMDNIFNFFKFPLSAHYNKVLAHGVLCIYGCRVPRGSFQKEQKSKLDQGFVCGAVMIHTFSKLVGNTIFLFKRKFLIPIQSIYWQQK